MKTQLLCLIKVWLIGILVQLSVGMSGQTLVNYSFNNNLNPDPTPAAGLNPVLQYFDPPNMNPITPTNYDYGYLNFANDLDYVRLSYNSSTYDGVILQFTGGIGVFFAIANGNIKAYLKIGSGVETQIDSHNFSAFFIGIDTYNFSVPLPSADLQPQVEVRIEGSSNSFGLFTFFGIDNLALVKNTTQIQVKSASISPAFPNIPYAASASVTYDTDFGSFLTNEENVDKAYTIKNTGNKKLMISSMTIVPNNVGFSFVGTTPTVIGAGNSANFTVRFAPLDQGVQAANVVIDGNIVPANPFSFEVKGAGKSCNLSAVPIVQYGFNGNPPSNMPIVSVAGYGTPKYVGGMATAPNPNSFGGRLYSVNNNNNSSLFSTDPNSLYARGNDTGTVVLEFGPVDITNQQEVSINFDLAAYGTTSTTSSGVSNSDNVVLSVWNGGAWSEEIKLTGAANNNRRKYAYGAQELASYYDGDNTPTSASNSAGNGNYGKFVLNIPASANLNSLRFRIKAATNNNVGLWLIDNVHVDAGNAKSKTWTGSGWTGEDTSRPTSREKAVFAGSYNFTGSQASDLSVCECEVNNGVNLTIPAGRMLSVRNKIINAGAGDNFVVESDGNLLQEENSIVNANNITSKRLIHIGSARNQYNYLGTPVNFQTGESFQTIFPGSSTTVLYYNQATNYFSTSSGVNIPGRGMAVKEPTVSTAIPAAATNTTGIFKGVPQNGAITIPIANKDAGVNTYGYNLVGNPYPSNIDLLKLYDLNGGRTGSSQIESPNISATFYFWDNTGNTQMTQQGSGYGGQAYALFNVLTGTNGTGTKSMLGSKVPTNILKVGQGFMTRSLTASYNFKFNNGIRTNSTSGVDFLGQRQADIQDDRYWLQMTAPSGITSTIAIVYYAGGNNLFGAEDSRSLGGSDALYSRVEGEKVAIDGRSTFVETDQIPLGSQHYTAGTYTISLDAAEGRFAKGQNIYLRDVQTGIITNLSAGSYTFAASAGESTGRFEIIYKPEAVLATDSAVKEDVMVYRRGGDFVVKAASKEISILEMYDAVGRLMYKVQPNSTDVIIGAERFPSGVYILRIDQHGVVTTKKVVK